MRQEQRIKEVVGSGLIEGEIELKGKKLAKLLVGSVVGGLVGALGIGGGVVFNPLLIGMGVPPAVASATGMYMIIFSSGATSIMMMSYGALPLDFALWIGLWSALGIYLCLSILAKILKKTNRPSIIVFVLASVLLVSAIMVPIFAG